MKNSIKIMLIVIAILNATIFSQSNENSELFNIFEYRNFSPHRVGSWISDIAVPETNNHEHKYTFYVSGRHAQKNGGNGNFVNKRKVSSFSVKNFVNCFWEISLGENG